MAAVPKFDYGAPPELAGVPAGCVPTRELTEAERVEALRPTPRAALRPVPRFQRTRRTEPNEETTMAQPEIPTLSTPSKPERFIALRREGKGRAEAGREAGYDWKNTNSMNVCARAIEKRFGFEHREERAAARAAGSKRPGQVRDAGPPSVPKPSTRVPECVIKARDELAARRDGLNEAIAAMEKAMATW